MAWIKPSKKDLAVTFSYWFGWVLIKVKDPIHNKRWHVPRGPKGKQLSSM